MNNRILRMLGMQLTTLLALVGCTPLGVINALTPSDGYQVSKDIAYGGLARQKLDIYTPNTAQAGRPVVIFFYGGRWRSGSKDDYLFTAQALTSRGFVVVLPDYRLYPEVKFPTFAEDAAHAVAWTRQHINNYGGNPQQLFIMGHSAGAHIAAMLALDDRFLRAVDGSPDWLSGMIGLAGPYDFLPLDDDDLRDMFGPPERYALSQPINFAKGDAPPLLLLHGRDDAIVWLKNTLNLTAKMREKGGPVKTIIYDELGHLTILGALSSALGLKATVLDDVSTFIRERSSVTSSGTVSQPFSTNNQQP